MHLACHGLPSENHPLESAFSLYSGEEEDKRLHATKENKERHSFEIGHRDV